MRTRRHNRHVAQGGWFTYEGPPQGGQTPTQRKMIVDETRHVLRIRNGRVDAALAPGIHRFRKRTDRVWSESALDQHVTVAGQEIHAADGAIVRATVAAVVRVVDPITVFNRGEWNQMFHLRVQLALRQTVAGRTIDELLDGRDEVNAELRRDIEPVATELGLELVELAVRDLVVPGDLKRAMGEVVAARLHGQAALERARGETAALRSLANAARMVDDHPGLIQLRLLQQMESTDGNTYVVGTGTPLG